MNVLDYHIGFLLEEIITEGIFKAKVADSVALTNPAEQVITFHTVCSDGTIDVFIDNPRIEIMGYYISSNTDPYLRRTLDKYASKFFALTPLEHIVFHIKKVEFGSQHKLPFRHAIFLFDLL